MAGYLGGPAPPPRFWRPRNLAVVCFIIVLVLLAPGMGGVGQLTCAHGSRISGGGQGGPAVSLVARWEQACPGGTAEHKLFPGGKENRPPKKFMFQPACLKLPKSVHAEWSINIFSFFLSGFFWRFWRHQKSPQKFTFHLVGISLAVLLPLLFWHPMGFHAPGCTAGSNPGLLGGCPRVGGVVAPGNGDF